MRQNLRWRLASFGLRLKLVAAVFLVILICVTGIILVTDPRMIASHPFTQGALIAAALFWGFDFVGRSCCVATPGNPLPRVFVAASIGCQFASLAFFVTPFFTDRQLALATRPLIGVFPAAVMQVAAAVLFMRFARDVAYSVQRPDLAVLPARILVMFGIAGPSLAAILTLLTILFLVFACCGAPFGIGALLVYVWEERPIFLLPITVLVFPVLVIPLGNYGALLYRLAGAIDTWQDAGESPFKK